MASASAAKRSEAGDASILARYKHDLLAAVEDDVGSSTCPVSARVSSCIVDILTALLDETFNLKAIAASKVGHSLSKLRKHADAGVAKAAKAVVKKWKAQQEAAIKAASVSPTPSAAEAAAAA
ncbi:unnamed protein product, partial [Symbiodinium sp. KB8]